MDHLRRGRDNAGPRRRGNNVNSTRAGRRPRAPRQANVSAASICEAKSSSWNLGLLNHVLNEEGSVKRFAFSTLMSRPANTGLQKIVVEGDAETVRTMLSRSMEEGEGNAVSLVYQRVVPAAQTLRQCEPVRDTRALHLSHLVQYKTTGTAT